MNEHPDGASRGTGSSVAVGFVLGALVGAGIALLLAPRTGKETRRRLAEAGERWGSAARGTLDRARDTARDFAQDAKSAAEGAREAFEHGRRSDPRTPASPSRTEGSGSAL
jgi:gas vesicle protein